MAQKKRWVICWFKPASKRYPSTKPSTMWDCLKTKGGTQKLAVCIWYRFKHTPCGCTSINIPGSGLPYGRPRGRGLGDLSHVSRTPKKSPIPIFPLRAQRKACFAPPPPPPPLLAGLGEGMSRPVAKATGNGDAKEPFSYIVPLKEIMCGGSPLGRLGHWTGSSVQPRTMSS